MSVRGRLVFLAALAILGLVACETVPRPFQPPGDIPADPLTMPEEIVGIFVEPVAGTTTPMARMLGQALAEALERQGLAVASETGCDRCHRLASTVEPGPGAPAPTAPAFVRWSLVAPSGTTVTASLEPVRGPKENWEYGDPRLVRAVTLQIAKVVAGRVGEDETDAKAAQTPREGVFIKGVGGGPEKANSALTRAMRAALRGTKLSPADDPQSAAFVVEGWLDMDPPFDGRQVIRLTWTVKNGNGGEVGKARQENAVPANATEAEWARISALAVTAAIDSIGGIVDRARGGL